MVGANTAMRNMRRGLVTVILLLVPLLAGCVASPDATAIPRRTATFTDPAPAASPSRPGTPSTEPVVIGTPGPTAKVFLKVEHMTATSWRGSVPGIGARALMVTVQCRGEGNVRVVPTGAQMGAWGSTGACLPPGRTGSLDFAMPAPTSGTMGLEVTAPAGSEWALVVTEAPPGTLLD
ncbi:hypothetical protein [Arthrobacter sp. RAF14]|uniref:hypothetical protein n=1 Tax=Arthrobacter sp. RAF14 TaxID=3233051 RepID=UPI003F9276EA